MFFTTKAAVAAFIGVAEENRYFLTTKDTKVAKTQRVAALYVSDSAPWDEEISLFLSKNRASVDASIGG